MRSCGSCRGTAIRPATCTTGLSAFAKARSRRFGQYPHVARDTKDLRRVSLRNRSDLAASITIALRQSVKPPGLRQQSWRFDDLLTFGGQTGQRQRRFRFGRRRWMQRRFLEPEIEFVTAAVAWER